MKFIPFPDPIRDRFLTHRALNPCLYLEKWHPAIELPKCLQATLAVIWVLKTDTNNWEDSVQFLASYPACIVLSEQHQILSAEVRPKP